MENTGINVVELIMPEGKPLEIERKKGNVMESQVAPEQSRTDIELLKNIERKLDLLLAAQSSN